MRVHGLSGNMVSDQMYGTCAQVEGLFCFIVGMNIS